MAAAGELLSELVRAHFDDDRVRFSNVLSQLIAAESRSGHIQVARRLKEIRDLPREVAPRSAVPLARTKRDLRELLDISYSSVTLGDLLLEDELTESLRSYVIEHRSSELLASHGLTPRRKLLLHGPPGTGKTLTAFALAGELKLPVARVRLELLFSKLMGETASALSDIFAEASRLRAVYLFDEFDALGRERQAASDVGEIRRVVGTFLQLLDADQSQSIFVAATNIPDSIDIALLRRFDDVLDYSGPTRQATEVFLKRGLRGQRVSASGFARLVDAAGDLSLADTRFAIESAKKQFILQAAEQSLTTLVEGALVKRRRGYVHTL